TKIILTFVLVPLFGIMGAAYATLAGYIMVEITLFIVVQRFYYIRYEYERIIKLSLTVAIAFVAAKLLDANVPVKLLLFAAWCGSLFAVGFFTEGELVRVKRLFVKST
ncbi:MAG: polysaccharide biosynthesis C-terminal domain-containing protein, partial [Bacteroidota bacterium]